MKQRRMIGTAYGADVVVVMGERASCASGFDHADLLLWRGWRINLDNLTARMGRALPPAYARLTHALDWKGFIGEFCAAHHISVRTGT